MADKKEDERKGRRRGTWETDNMHHAVDKVLSGKMTLRMAADRYQVPRSTLNDRVCHIKQNKEICFKPMMGRFERTFSPEQEKILVEHVKDLANRLMPLNKTEFLNLVFKLAESFNIPHQFNKEKQSAGKYFYYDFMKRHSDLSLRIPESTSLMRAIGFNKAQVDRFFDCLHNLFEKFNFTSYRIWNCDETGVSIVHKHAKVLAPKNQKQVGKLTSAERGKNVTVLFAMSAGGQFIPPFFIFPRQRMNDRLMINSPNESVAEVQPNGWMNSELFLKWMAHFVKYTNPSEESPILLILDGHASHKDLDVINFATKKHIHMLSTPPHTTHKLQPLDRTFMKPFKTAYNDACDLWMRANAGLKISEYEIAGFVASAFNRVSRVDIGVNGFRCTGIYPFNRNIFDDLDFLPSSMTNISENNPPSNLSETTVDPTVDQAQQSSYINSQPSTSHQLDPQLIAQPSTSRQGNAQLDTQPSTSQLLTDSFKEIVKELSPFPDVSKRRATSRRRKAERSEILTDSPYKTILEEKRVEKQRVESMKRGKKLLSGKDVSKKSKKSKKIDGNKQQQATSEQTTCPLCLESHEEDWIQCGNCKAWVHEACANISEYSNQYICDYCTV